jgi:DNA-binding CsgD family transcriptional regulator
MAVRLIHGAKEIVLAHGVFLVGRAPDADVRLTSGAVSRQHAAIRVGLRGTTVEDLDSRNGVLVNGERVQGMVHLAAGDRLTLGREELRVLETEGGPHAERADPVTSETQQVFPPGSGAPPRERRRRATPPGSVQSLSLLSAREREVLRLVASGLSQREIGERLGISPKTVETYRSRIVDKLGLPSRAAMVQYALNVGLLRPE